MILIIHQPYTLIRSTLAQVVKSGNTSEAIPLSQADPVIAAKKIAKVLYRVECLVFSADRTVNIRANFYRYSWHAKTYNLSRSSAQTAIWQARPMTKGLGINHYLHRDEVCMYQLAFPCQDIGRPHLHPPAKMPCLFLN